MRLSMFRDTVLACIIATVWGAPTLKSGLSPQNDRDLTTRPSQEIAGLSKNGVPWKAPDHMPANDEWYRPKPGYEQKKPGDILKWRQVPRGLSVDNKHAVKLKAAYQLQYRTTNSVGGPDATIVTVLAPYNAKNDSLFMYHWFSDATFQDCNPSIAMQIGTREDNAYTQKQNLILISALSQGWYVSVADDSGTRALFGNGRYQGQAALDSIRAVKQSSEITGISSDPTTVSFGYSGGSIAGSWMAELQPSYAPDVKLAGVSLGGLIPNMTEIFRQGEAFPSRSAYSGPAIVGMSKDFKNMTDWIDDNLRPEKADEFRYVYSQCFDSNWNSYTNKSFGDYFKDGYSSLFSPIPRSVMERAGTLGLSGVPTAPMYTFMTATDEATPVSSTDELIDRYCQKGANILYERNPGNLTHAQELINALPGAMRWIADRYEGIPTLRGCHKYEKTAESVRAAKQRFFLMGLAGNALAIFGGMAIGPSPWTAWLSQFPS